MSEYCSLVVRRNDASEIGSLYGLFLVFLKNLISIAFKYVSSFVEYIAIGFNHFQYFAFLSFLQNLISESQCWKVKLFVMLSNGGTSGYSHFLLSPL